MSCWNKPTRELNTVVIAPNHKHISNTVELYSIKGDERINKYTPAVHLCWLFFNEHHCNKKNLPLRVNMPLNNILEDRVNIYYILLLNNTP